MKQKTVREILRWSQIVKYLLRSSIMTQSICKVKKEQEKKRVYIYIGLEFG